MNKFLLLVFFALCCGVPNLSAQSVADSLIQLLPETKGDTARARLYKAIVDQLGDQPQRALRYAKRGLQKSQSMKWSKGVGVFSQSLGGIYNDLGHYEQAEKYIQSALVIHQQNRDSFNLASTYNSLGNVYSHRGQNLPAVNACLKALQIAEQSGSNTLLPTILGNIALMYSNQRNFNKAFAYQRKALSQYRLLLDSAGIASSYKALANFYQLQGDTTQALQYYQRSIDLYRQQKTSLKLAEVYQNQALLYAASTPARLERQLQAQAIWDQHLPAHQLSITNLGNIAWTYLELAKQNPRQHSEALQQASRFCDRAIRLANAAQDKGNQHFLLSLKAVLEAAKGHHEVAYHALYQYIEQYDSIYSQDSKNKLAEAESKYLLDKKNNEIAIQNLTISNQRKIQWAFALGSLLLALITFLLYRVSQIRRKSNQQLRQLNQSLDQANRQKAQLLAVISHDLRHPLSNLIGLLHLQKNAPELLRPEQALESQLRITRHTEVLLENLENMLLWSKEQMNQASIQVAPVAIADIFQRLEQTYAQSSNLKWSFSCPADLIIETDPDYLWVIVQNLSANAQKALNGQSHPHITWTAWRDPAGVALEIQDNGPGFPLDFLNHPATPHATSSLWHGFGLQVVQDFAQKLNMKLQFENQASGGARVTLRC